MKGVDVVEQDTEILNAEVKWFNNVRGFGFLKAENGLEYFLHWSCIVPFETTEELHGRPYLTLKPMQQVEIHEARWDDERNGWRAEKVVKCP
jgi:cold shock CspA family protein